MREYGERLRARARELGLTDTDVARRLELAQSRYANYVAGNREPTLELFVRICKSLATTPNEILGIEQPNSDTDPLRIRAAASLASLEGRALQAAVILLEALAARQDELAP